MKFVETMNATFVNVDEISCIGHELCKELDKYYSYIYLKNGDKFDFLDLPDFFYDGEMRYDFECDHLISLHRHAIEELDIMLGPIVKLGDLMDRAWVLLMYEIRVKKES
jgi:ferredoxin